MATGAIENENQHVYGDSEENKIWQSKINKNQANAMLKLKKQRQIMWMNAELQRQTKFR